jgi:hypothetical protein
MFILLILILLSTVALVIVLAHSYKKNMVERVQHESTTKTNPNLECCGAHEVCEAETLLTLRDDIIYYSDEELDAYVGVGGANYTDAQIEEFRDVLLTLQMHEVTGWLKSLQLRGIEVPLPIREEALMIVEEFREIRSKNRAH